MFADDLKEELDENIRKSRLFQISRTLIHGIVMKCLKRLAATYPTEVLTSWSHDMTGSLIYVVTLWRIIVM